MLIWLKFPSVLWPKGFGVIMEKMLYKHTGGGNRHFVTFDWYTSTGGLFLLVLLLCRAVNVSKSYIKGGHYRRIALG